MRFVLGSEDPLVEVTLLYEWVIKAAEGPSMRRATVCDYFPVEKEYGYSVFRHEKRLRVERQMNEILSTLDSERLL